MTDEREDLDALLSSPGWERFKQHVESQWGDADGGGARFTTGMTAIAKEDDATALPKMRQIIAAQREIHMVMRWAADRLNTLKATQMAADSDAQPLSRRGGL